MATLGLVETTVGERSRKARVFYFIQIFFPSRTDTLYDLDLVLLTIHVINFLKIYVVNTILALRDRFMSHDRG